MRREIGGQVRRKLGGGDRTEPRDVWDSATTEPPPDLGEAPECAWCPVCQAARRIRESGPGLGSQLSGAGEAVAAAVQAALSAFEGVMSRTGPDSAAPSGTTRPDRPRAVLAWADDPRGRAMRLTIGVDVGGTKVAAGVVDEHGGIVEKLKRSTPAASPDRTATSSAMW